MESNFEGGSMRETQSRALRIIIATVVVVRKSDVRALLQPRADRE